MKYIQILIALLFIGCTNIKESQPTTLGTSTTNTAIEEKVEDVHVYASKKKDVSGQGPTKEKDIRVYFLEIRHADIKIPKTKYKDVMGFTAPKDISIPGLPDIGPK